jgi:hypothetical protein
MIGATDSGLKIRMLLCDSAQSVGGKLYILGGGWSRVILVQPPIVMALAVMISVPWTEANQRYMLTVRLLNLDGSPALVLGQQVKVEGSFEAGRPPGLQKGTPLDSSFALPFTLALPPATYVWELAISNDGMEQPVIDTYRFEVVENQPQLMPSARPY